MYKIYDITVIETVTYRVTAQNENDAIEVINNGDFDSDSKLASVIDKIIDVQEVTR